MFKGRKVTCIAIEFGLLTFVRASELRFVRWEEFDFDNVIWEILGKREAIENVKFSERGMKTSHIVPLSRQTIALLEKLKEYSGDNRCLFPGDRDPNKANE